MANDSSPEPGSSQEPTVPAQPVPSEGPLEVDDDDALDNDSTYNPSVGSVSETSSLNSSILDYRYKNGRRYHAFREGAYFVVRGLYTTWLPDTNSNCAKPNDEEEQTRMDLVHHIYSLILDGNLYLAPIGDHPQRVLDLGTGTGIWAIDFADDFPSAEVLGTDLSPIQPEWTPPNCAFEVDDFEAEWLYHTPFNFIHGRELEGCISDDDRLFQQALRHLVPGGYMELQAVAAPFLSDDGTAEKAVNAQLWLKTLCEGSAKFGKPIDCAPMWKAKMIAAGFENVQEERRKMPLGAWPKDPKLKEIGKFQAIQEAQAIESYTPQIFSAVLGWTQEEIQVFMAKVKNEIKDPTIHLYLPVHFLWGRKPRE